jgi:branched-subunit amino acid aminotransferase/4-amino-4-deoxychorismate lyase
VLVWLNGRWLAAREARVSALDRGLLHGDGVYDTWRTYAGRPFAVALHVRRLAAAARRLGLPPPGPPALWERRSRLLVARNHLADAAVRLTLTRGAAGETLVPERRRPPTLLLTVRPLPTDLVTRQRDGVRVVALTFPRDAAPAWGWLKLIGHPGAVLGRSTATRRRAAEALYVNGAREVTEATSANVFICERDAIVTPPLSAGILPGVTRAIVLALARRGGLAVREAAIPLRRLRRAREVFLTASTTELLPVIRVDDRTVGNGKPGPITRLLQARYARHVASSMRSTR